MSPAYRGPRAADVSPVLPAARPPSIRCGSDSTVRAPGRPPTSRAQVPAGRPRAPPRRDRVAWAWLILAQGMVACRIELAPSPRPDPPAAVGGIYPTVTGRDRCEGSFAPQRRAGFR